MSDLVVQNVRVVSPASGRDEIVDVHVRGSAIADFLPPKSPPPPDARVVDGTDQVMLPGPIDLLCTFRSPGQEDIETVDETLHAAARGGFTCVVAAPKTHPPIDHAGAVAAMAEQLRAAALGGHESGAERIHLVAGATTTGDGRTLAEIGLMAKAGAALVTNFPDAALDVDVTRRILELAASTDCPALFWGEDALLGAGAVVSESAVSTFLGVNGTPVEAEAVRAFAVAALASRIRPHGASDRGSWRAIFGPVSTAATLEALGAKAESMGAEPSSSDAMRASNAIDGTTTTPVMNAEGLACAWSLLLDEQVHRTRPYDVNLALHPPLRSATDRDALVAAAAAGQLAVCSGHRPQAPQDKEVEFGQAKVGGSGLELAIPALVSVGDNVSPAGGLTPEAAAVALAETPARLLGAPPNVRGHLRIGDVANFVVLSAGDNTPLGESHRRTGCADAMGGRCRHSPYLGLPRRSRVELTVACGRILFQAALSAPA